jgi:hypothetical protein
MAAVRALVCNHRIGVESKAVTAELPELKGADLQRLYYRSQFAVAETSSEGVRVLCLMDDQTAATEMAEELRRRGVRAGAFRTAR